MNTSVNSSRFGLISRFLRYCRSITWERGLVVLFCILIAGQVGIFACAKFVYEKMNERTPIYVNCDEVSRAEQMKELRGYIASSTEKSKKTMTKSKSGYRTTKTSKKILNDRSP